jgi:hypothetical protein
MFNEGKNNVVHKWKFSEYLQIWAIKSSRKSQERNSLEIVCTTTKWHLV